MSVYPLSGGCVEAPAYAFWKRHAVSGARFGHYNHASVEGSFANVTFNWAYYLKSLTDYLDSGQVGPAYSIS